MELRRIKDNVALWAKGKVNVPFVLARFKTMQRLGVTRLMSAFGWKVKWHEDDFHLQHIIDAYAGQVTKPYDGAVAYYNNVATEEQRTQSRWLSYVNNWKTLLPRLSAKNIVSTHLTMLQDPTVHIIAEHFEAELDAIEHRAPKPAENPVVKPLSA
jgi:thioesterase domain-containing protein